MSHGGRDVDTRPAEEHADYREVRSNAALWLGLPQCAAALASGRFDFLLAGPARRRQRPGGGRGPLVPLDLGGQAAIGKRCLHGGLAGRLLGGVYLGRGRLEAQIRASGTLRRAGVPTPEVLAVGWRRLAGPLQAHAIITRTIPAACNLLEAGPSSRERRREILVESARLIRDMHDAGFLHGDLNVTNLVLGETPAGDRIHVVDLDRGRLLSRLGVGRRHDNLARLLRSHEKWMAPITPLSPREEVLFLRSYCGGDRRLFDVLRARMRRYRVWLRLRGLVRAVGTRRRGAAPTVRPPP